MNFRLPVYLDITGKNCVVVGEGYEVPAKVERLMEAGANVTYVNPTAHELIQALAGQGLIRWERRGFDPGDLDSVFLVITDSEHNAEIFCMAEEKRVLCNAVDDPENCRFSFGSVHRQGDLTIGISTNGNAPAVAVRLREWLQREIGPEYGELLELLKSVRPEITTRIASFDRRRTLWYEIVDSEILSLLRNSDRSAAEILLRKLIDNAAI